MKFLYAVYAGLSGVDPSLIGLFPTKAVAKRIAKKTYEEDEDWRVEVVRIVKVPVGIEIDWNTVEQWNVEV